MMNTSRYTQNIKQNQNFLFNTCQYKI